MSLGRISALRSPVKVAEPKFSSVARFTGDLRRFGTSAPSSIR